MEKPNLIYSKHNVDVCADKISAASIHYYDLTIVLRGTLEYRANGEHLRLDAGSVMCLSPATIRERANHDTPADYISFNFTSDTPPTIPTLTEDLIGSDILLLINAYDELNRRSYLDNKEKIEHLLACLILTLEGKIVQRKYNPLTLKIIKYLHANLGNRITLEDIGRITFFSPIYCDSVFKKETGRSIIDYLLDARITEAKRLLAVGAVSLSLVSELVGFDDYNYFSRTFKKRTGYTPREYRKISSEQ